VGGGRCGPAHCRVASPKQMLQQQQQQRQQQPAPDFPAGTPAPAHRHRHQWLLAFLLIQRQRRCLLVQTRCRCRGVEGRARQHLQHRADIQRYLGIWVETGAVALPRILVQGATQHVASYSALHCTAQCGAVQHTPTWNSPNAETHGSSHSCSGGRVMRSTPGMLASIQLQQLRLCGVLICRLLLRSRSSGHCTRVVLLQQQRRRATLAGRWCCAETAAGYSITCSCTTIPVCRSLPRHSTRAQAASSPVWLAVCGKHGAVAPIVVAGGADVERARQPFRYEPRGN
jgi:hypothetical protein